MVRVVLGLSSVVGVGIVAWAILEIWQRVLEQVPF